MLQAALLPPAPLVWVFLQQFMMMRMLLSTGLRKFLPIPLPACGMLSLPGWDVGSPQLAGAGDSGDHGQAVMPMGTQTQSCCSSLPQAGALHLHLGRGAGRRPPATLLHHQQRGATLLPPELLHPVAERVPCPRWVRGVAPGCPKGSGLGLAPLAAHPMPSLPSGLWNLIFLFSNLSLVFLMPFAYFFTESEGFAGSKKVSDSASIPPAVPCPSLTPLPQGIMARVYETSVVLLLLTLLVLGMVWVASAIVSNDAASRQSLYGGCCRGAWGSGGAASGPGAEGMPGAGGLTLLPPQTSGNTTCPTSTPASRSLACCFCCVSRGMFPRGALAPVACPAVGVGALECPAGSRGCSLQMVLGSGGVTVQD